MIPHLSDEQVILWVTDEDDSSIQNFSEPERARIREHLNHCPICLLRVIQEHQAFENEKTYTFSPGHYQSQSEAEREAENLIEFLKGHEPETELLINLDGVVATREFVSALIRYLIQEFGVGAPCIHDYWIVIQNLEPRTREHLRLTLDEFVLATLEEVETERGLEREILGEVLGNCIQVLYRYLKETGKEAASERDVKRLLDDYPNRQKVMRALSADRQMFTRKFLDPTIDRPSEAVFYRPALPPEVYEAKPA